MIQVNHVSGTVYKSKEVFVAGEWFKITQAAGYHNFIKIAPVDNSWFAKEYTDWQTAIQKYKNKSMVAELVQAELEFAMDFNPLDN